MSEEKTLIEMSQEELVAKAEEQAATIADLTAKNQEQAEVIEEMTKELESLSKKKTIKNPTVKVGGKSFEVVIPRFKHKGEVYTADDVAKDKSLAEELIEQGSGVLKAN